MIKESALILDLDNTIYQGHSFFDIADHLRSNNLLSTIAHQSIYSELERYKKGQTSYSQAANNLLQIFAQDLSGKEYHSVALVIEEYFNCHPEKFYSYFTKLLPVLRDQFDIFIVTTNSQMVAEAVVKIFNLKSFLSTDLEVSNSKFTGKILTSLADGKDNVKQILSQYQGQTVGIGDSENDLAILEQVTTPICIDPTPELLTVAQHQNWIIASHNDDPEQIYNLITQS